MIINPELKKMIKWLIKTTRVKGNIFWVSYMIESFSFSSMIMVFMYLEYFVKTIICISEIMIDIFNVLVTLKEIFKLLVVYN